MRALFALIFFLAALPQALGVQLAWDAPADPTVVGYRLRYGSSVGNYSTTIDVLNTTTATVPDANFLVGVQYFFTVVAYNADNVESLPSNEVAWTYLPPDPRLASLTLSTGTLAPAFAAGVTAYTATVPNAAASVIVTATASPSGTTMTFNGVPGTSGLIPLVVGTNNVFVVATHPDGVTRRTYTITITRAPSSLADLLSLSTDKGGPLVPVFSPGVMLYQAIVPKDATTVVVTTTPAAGATVKINGVAGATSAIATKPGRNVVTVVVTAQDGISSRTYTLRIDRRPWEPVNFRTGP